MKFEEHFTDVYDGLFLNFKTLEVSYEGGLIFKTMGCGCCSSEERVTLDNVKKAIEQTEHFLKHLKELKNRIEKNDPLPKKKVVFE
jgi:hypothetical protein